MQRNKKTMENPVLLGQLISVGSTAVLILLMLIYLVTNITASAKLAAQTEIISAHPFEVVISTGTIQRYISEMSLRTERLQRHHEEVDIQLAREAIAELHILVNEPLTQMEDLYLGNPQDVANLRSSFLVLKETHLNFLDYVSLPHTAQDEIESYEATYLQPLYTEVMEQTNSIIETAQARKIGYGENAESLRQSTLVSSCVLICLMIVVLLVSQNVLHRQRQALIYRNHLFDSLSLSIDDAFIIRDFKTNEISYRALNLERVMGSNRLDIEGLYSGLTPEDAEFFREALKNPNFESPLERLVEYTKENKEKNWVLIRVYRVDNRDKPQLITVFSDRSKDVSARNTIQEALLAAENANTAKSEFLSRMSHEIRTPLNAIIGMTTIAATSLNDPDRIKDCLSKITFSSKHLLMLINDVLDMSKIESKKMALQNEPFDIFEITNGFVSTVYAQAKAKNIAFSEHMEGFGTDTVFIGDSLRLSQILLNLSSNALKFTPPGGKIALSVSRISSKESFDIIRFSLSDTGIGMTSDAVERIFRPFEQADASISKRYGGTGLGMSITKNLVSLMGGNIQVESCPNVGTTCIVDLPFKKGFESEISVSSFDNHNLSALIVDDDQPVCEQTSALLSKIKIRSEWTLSSLQAIDMIKDTYRNGHTYDLCLIDWKMPDMDGIELTRRIRREVGNDLPIIMISAYDITEFEAEARAVGVNGFLPKPLYRSSVYTTIKQTLEHSSASPSEHSGNSSILNGCRLLVAEDNALNQEIAATLLKMNGAEIECVDNGRDALNKFLSSPTNYYDAILMDVQMPFMDGYEATTQIRSSSHPSALTIPIIATTANAFNDDISMALASGMNAHVSKPLDIDKLCETLYSCIEAAKNKKD